MLNASGDLLIADAARGLVVVDRSSRRTAVLSARVSPGAGPHAGTPIMLADDLDIAGDGTIYFSDATAFAPPRQVDGSYDAMAPATKTMLEASCTGRLLRYDPASGHTAVLADGIWFANGVALAPDESYVVVAETLGARLLRVWLRGPKAGKTEVFADNLPGLPDGLSRASSPPGAFWVACVRVPPCKGLQSLETLARWRLLRWALLRLPLPRPLDSPHGLVLKVDDSGRVIQALHDATGEAARTVTAVTEHAGKLYLGSLAPDLHATPVLDLAAVPR
ncbi:hypothetical protein WJX81_000750 [Elliptochloris bilobata]|uniref:Strictosidine synthase conserved region domain-containing protein n=1 Tax=Elliptochloris bilobata TaxID=381761 RepID=A0AAW1SIG9_9CHLO